VPFRRQTFFKPSLFRLYDWTTQPRKDIRDVVNSQASNTKAEFERKTKEVILQFAEQVIFSL